MRKQWVKVSNKCNLIRSGESTEMIFLKGKKNQQGLIH